MERMKLRKVTNGTSTKEKSAVPFYNFFLSKLLTYCVYACMWEDTPIKENSPILF